VVICSGVVEYLKNDELWIKQVSGVLKPNGILIVNVTNAYAIRRWSMPFINIFKSIPGIFATMNFIKTKILRMEKLNSFPFKPRVHSPKQFDKFMNSQGLKKLSHNYFDFSIFPYPVDTVLNFILLKARKRMEKYTKTNAWLTGNGYIVKCKKNR
ncbi:MAG: class I SAM-dependent methyltransferase, partial [Candidatus Delongbacteria bacterium]|nr:class I SAM-dependent methyltransferase [Candidatus Delongbacteria bacterium]MCG2761043.1 class I SAM-dependent methyltransferase [Candidatus Delongbacteria bacterium]